MKGFASVVFALCALLFLSSPPPVRAQDDQPIETAVEYEACIIPKDAQPDRWRMVHARFCEVVTENSVMGISPLFNQFPAGEDDRVFHTVRSIDTLSGIADTYKTTVEDLLLVNPEITNPNLIYDGYKVLIPTEEELAQMRAEKEAKSEAEQRELAAQFAKDNPKWIEVNLEKQSVNVFDGEFLVKTFTVSTGTAAHPTVTGEYRIYIKLDQQNMSGPGYYLEDVPYVMYFHKGYGLHGTYWHNNFGTPMSHGCVNLRTEDAQWLYEFAEIGTLVYVH